MKTNTMKNKEWKDVREIKASGKPNWYGGAYTIGFVYSNKGNFIVKGFFGEIKEYLQTLKDKGYKYIVNFTLWSTEEWSDKKQFRSIWSVSSQRTYIQEPEPKYKGQKRNKFKWSIVNYNDDNDNRKVLTFKRLPKKWIPEFDDIIN